MNLVRSLRPMALSAPVLGLGFCLTFGAASALAQKGGTGGGGGGLNQTTAIFLSGAPVLSAGLGSITHHKSTTDALIAFWQTYDANGVATWVELKDGHWVDGLTYTGTVHQPIGPAFFAPYDPTLVSDVLVGTAMLSFSDASDGTFTYTVNGVSGSKAITRTPF